MRGKVLSIHTTDSQELWFRVASQKPQKFVGGPDEFVDWLASKPEPIRQVRMLALPSNAAVGYRLLSTQNRVPPLRLGPPACLRNASIDVDIGGVFSRMDYMREVPPSVGGWRYAIPADVTTFAITEFVADRPRYQHGDLFEKQQQVSEQAMSLLSTHPAWPVLSFVHAAPLAAMRLIAAIHDPRWFVAVDSPDSTKTLCTHFGLGYRSSDRVQSLLRRSHDEKLQPLGLVLATWAKFRSGAVVSRRAPPFVYPWPCAEAAAAAQPDAVATACRVFLRMLNKVWLDNLTPARVYEPVARMLGKNGEPTMTTRLVPCQVYSPTLFIPEYDIVDDSQRAAWLEHVKTSSTAR